MRVGENIQLLRKQNGMSQEELGQKLLVSRQTVSLWEKGQTMPTIDNLIRLKEIFGVTVDELLGCADAQPDTGKVPPPAPMEQYRFHYQNDEMAKVYRCIRRIWLKQIILFVVLALLLIRYFSNVGSPEISGGCILGVALGGFFYFKSVHAQQKSWKLNLSALADHEHLYQVYTDHFTVSALRNDEQIQTAKVYPQSIDLLQDLGEYIMMSTGGQFLLLRKRDLDMYSEFYHYMRDNPKKTRRFKLRHPFDIISFVLMFAAIWSIDLALDWGSELSNLNKRDIENMWVFFALTPLPIASVVWGFIMKAKGRPYKKNIIVGIIMTVLMCIYGSFTFLFADTQSHSDMPYRNAEQELGIDLPEYEFINTRDYGYWEEQSFQNEVICFECEVYFDEVGSKQLEAQIAEGNVWLEQIPNHLIGITPSLHHYSTYDHSLIYNVDTGEYNTLPAENGTYRFIQLLYIQNQDLLYITEYDLDYTQ